MVRGEGGGGVKIRTRLIFRTCCTSLAISEPDLLGSFFQFIKLPINPEIDLLEYAQTLSSI